MPTQDELSLAEAVGRLTEENKNLKIDIANLGYSHSTAKAKAFGIALPLATAIALLVGYPSWKGIMASGQVEHCYIDFVPLDAVYRLKGKVDWREDPSFGDFPTVDQAKTQAAKLDCKMGPPQ
jgi:hypothetical protein